LPVPATGAPGEMAAALRYFPAVGLAIGAVAAAVLLLAATRFAAVPAVLVSTAAAALLTGALHEDGLADTLDGLGGANRERALAIMRESTIGTYGALGLGLVIATKVATLAALAPAAAATALVAGHATSRLSLLFVIASARYARPGGTGGFTAAGVATADLVIAGATGLLCLAGLAAGLGGIVALGGAAGMVVGHALARALFERRLGGYTGDCLGATQQLSELGLLLGVAACL
jgi:adenosylcobinamide-GDP ribazoletransferase